MIILYKPANFQVHHALIKMQDKSIPNFIYMQCVAYTSLVHENINRTIKLRTRVSMRTFLDAVRVGVEKFETLIKINS